MSFNPHKQLPLHPAQGFQQTPPPGTLALGTIVSVGRYRVIIERYLAEGGFAHVYVVRVEDGELAVLKRIACPDADALALFLNEIDFMKQLNGHPKVVRFYDSQTTQHAEGFDVLILMEYCQGGPVIDLMNRRLQNRLTEPEILKIFMDILEAVAHMHYCHPPIIHRDLKVENVLLDRTGGYKLCDFGSATTKLIPPRAALTVKDIQLLEDEIGRQTTLQYRAPEMVDLFQRRGINEKSDIWALGVLLYKLCYYTTPFEDTGALAILSAKYTIPNRPSFSAELIQIIGWTLQEEAMLRPNIYELLSSVSRLRSVECPIRNIYPERSNIISQPEPNLPIHNKTQPIQDQQQANPNIGLSNTPNNIQPMRRGRPTRHEKTSSIDNLMSPSGGASSTQKAANSTGFDDIFGGPAQSASAISDSFSGFDFNTSDKPRPSGSHAELFSFETAGSNKQSFFDQLSREGGSPSSPSPHIGTDAASIGTSTTSSAHRLQNTPLVVTSLERNAGGSRSGLNSTSIASFSPQTIGQFSSQMNQNIGFPNTSPHSPGNAAFKGNVAENSFNSVSNISINSPLSGRTLYNSTTSSPSYPTASSMGNSQILPGFNTMTQNPQQQRVLMEPMRPWSSTGCMHPNPTTVATPTGNDNITDPFACLSPLNQAWPSSPATNAKSPSMANSTALSSSGSFQRPQLQVNAGPNRLNQILPCENPASSTNTVTATTTFDLNGRTTGSKNKTNMIEFDAFSQ